MTTDLVCVLAWRMKGTFTRLKKYSSPTQVIPATKWIQRSTISKMAPPLVGGWNGMPAASGRLMWYFRRTGYVNACRCKLPEVASCRLPARTKANHKGHEALHEGHEGKPRGSCRSRVGR